MRVDVSYRTLVLSALALFGIWLLFIKLWPIVVLLLSATIFMTALRPYVAWLERHGLGRGAAVAAVAVIILAAVAALLYLVIPPMLSEFGHLRTDLPAYGRTGDRFADRLGFTTHLEQSAQGFEWSGLVNGQSALTYGEQAVFGLLSAFTIVVITIYLLLDTERLERFIFQFVPAGREPEIVAILQSLGRVVGGYVRGQFITSAIIATFTVATCLAAGVPNAIAFGVLAGVADIIPLFGPFLSVAPATAAAARESPAQAIAVAVALLGYQQFEDRFLVPRVYGRTLNLPPLIVIVAILAGGELLGVVGVLLALPAAAALRVAVDYWIEHRRTGSANARQTPADDAFAADITPGSGARTHDQTKAGINGLRIKGARPGEMHQ